MDGKILSKLEGMQRYHKPQLAKVFKGLLMNPCCKWSSHKWSEVQLNYYTSVILG